MCACLILSFAIRCSLILGLKFCVGLDVAVFIFEVDEGVEAFCICPKNWEDVVDLMVLADLLFKAKLIEEGIDVLEADEFNEGVFNCCGLKRSGVMCFELKVKTRVNE